MKKTFLVFALIISTYNFSFAEVSTTTSTSTSHSVDICKVINSIDVYTIPNLYSFQMYLKNTYFPKVKLTGYNDTQNKYWIGKFQYAFGLKPTGVLNPDTIKQLRTINNCFDIEKKVLFLETSTPTKIVEQQDIITELLNRYVYNIFTSATSTNSDVTVTSATQ